MANPHRGHVDLTAGGVVYRLVFNNNAICELENLMDKPAQAIFEGLGNPGEIRIGVIRNLLWAGLREHHEELTLKDVSRVIDECGLAEAFEVVQEAIMLAFPPADEPADDRPTKRRKAGTG